MAEPDDPITFPNLTIVNMVVELREAAAWTDISARRLLAPIIFVDRTALSVDMSMNFSTLNLYLCGSINVLRDENLGVREGRDATKTASVA